MVDTLSPPVTAYKPTFNRSGKLLATRNVVSAPSSPRGGVRPKREEQQQPRTSKSRRPYTSTLASARPQQVSPRQHRELAGGATDSKFAAFTPASLSGLTGVLSARVRLKKLPVTNLTPLYLQRTLRDEPTSPLTADGSMARIPAKGLGTPSSAAPSPEPASSNQQREDGAEGVDQVYADRAEALYLRAVERVRAERRAGTLAASWNALVAMQGESQSDQTPPAAAAQQQQQRHELPPNRTLKKRRTARAMARVEARERAQAATHASMHKHATGLGGDESSAPQPRGAALASQWGQMWDVATSPAHGARTSPSWGGVGWHYELAPLRQSGGGGEDVHHPTLRPGWSEQVAVASDAFDERHARFSARAQRLLHIESRCLASVAPSHVDAIDDCLLGFRVNRFTMQPLRLARTSVMPRATPRGSGEHTLPLALSSSRRGGPLVRVHERVLADGSDKPVDSTPIEWTLFGSIWGPRCEWCDGRDFFDHEEVLFERFSADFQACIRLGLAKMVTDYDEQGTADDDGDGVPDELEDVGHVLCEHHELLVLAHTTYADAMYGAGTDLDVGVKMNDGWRCFNEECHVWDGLPESRKNNASLIFMSNDKADAMTCHALSTQAGFRGRLRGNGANLKPPPAPHGERAALEVAQIIDAGVEAAARAAMAAMADPANAFRSKPSRQLTRPEFINAIVKMAIERFVRTRQNPKNELDDVSDALERVLVQHVRAALGVPQAGRQYPRLPKPDAFRRHVCYTRAMSLVLQRHAPSLRVLVRPTHRTPGGPSVRPFALAAAAARSHSRAVARCACPPVCRPRQAVEGTHQVPVRGHAAAAQGV